MRDKHIKTWLFVFVGTLTVASGAASFFAQQKTLYNGLEPLQKLNGKFAQTSVLSAQTATVSQAAAQAAAPAEIPAEPQQAPALLEPVSSPCGADEKPIIKNSQIAGCAKENLSLRADVSLRAERSNLPAPKIKILESSSPPVNPPSAVSCESNGRFTYTGEDRPGLLYGMCIDCLTTQFIQYGNKCK